MTHSNSIYLQHAAVSNLQTEVLEERFHAN